MAVEVHIAPSQGTFKCEIGLFLTYSDLDEVPSYIGHTTQCVEGNEVRADASVYWLSGQPDEEAIALWADDITDAVIAFVKSGKTQEFSNRRFTGNIGETILLTGGECDPREVGFDTAQRVIEKYRQMKYRK
jgi:hypothetical protein